MHQNAPLSDKKSKKNFWGGGTAPSPNLSPLRRGYPLRRPTSLGASILALSTISVPVPFHLRLEHCREGWGLRRECPPPQWERGLGRGRCGGTAPSPEFFLIFCLGMLHFGDITRPVPNSLHSQPAESSDIIKPASAKLGKGCRAF